MKSFHFHSLESTQDKAFEILDSGERGPFCISVDHQTKGRGRSGREWVFESGKSLAMSIGWLGQVDILSGLSLLAGLAVTRALADIPIELKWPNDLMVKNQKVGGILVESKVRGQEASIVIGIGMNLFSLSAGYSGLSKSIDKNIISDQISRLISERQTKSLNFFMDDYREKLWSKGRTIRFHAQSGFLEGILESVDDQGRLVLQSGDKFQLLESGEIISTDEQV